MKIQTLLFIDVAPNFYVSISQGLSNLIFACTDFPTCKMVLHTGLCIENYVWRKQWRWALIYIQHKGFSHFNWISTSELKTDQSRKLQYQKRTYPNLILLFNEIYSFTSTLNNHWLDPIIKDSGSNHLKGWSKLIHHTVKSNREKHNDLQ